MQNSNKNVKNWIFFTNDNVYISLGSVLELFVFLEFQIMYISYVYTNPAFLA